MRLSDGRRFVYKMEARSRISSPTPEYVSFEVVVAYDEKKDYTYLFATNLSYKSKTILQMYRDRWGQETGYRMYDEFLIRTTSRNYVVRLFYFLFACLMYNAWVLYNSEQEEQRGKECSEIIVMQMKTLLLIAILLDILQAT